MLSLSKWEPGWDFQQALDTFSNLLSKLFVLTTRRPLLKRFCSNSPRNSTGLYPHFCRSGRVGRVGGNRDSGLGLS